MTEDVNVLNMYTIYLNAKDYPGVYSVRRFAIQKTAKAEPKEILGTAGTLQEARDLLPDGLHCVGRMAEDEPHIVESWV